mgnify:CR=1 FL=1
MKYDAKDFGLLANLQYNAATFSAFKNHSFQKEIHKLDRDMARLDGAILTQSEGAVEEKLAEVIRELTRARQRAA